jgi:putative SOS response-associated peptidase YedK
MCGRFTLSKKAIELIEELPDFEFDETIEPRFNIAPSQPIVTLLNDGTQRSTFTSWGLVPSWTSNPAAPRPINARKETVFEKPSFKKLIRRKRCLIPASGWYEWRKVSGEQVKAPHYFRFKDGRTLTFGGLWDEWSDPDGRLIVSSVILTTEANPLCASVHHRMPVLIPPESRATWLSSTVDQERELTPLLSPWPDDEMERISVSTRVNSARVDDAACLEPVGATDLFDL